MLTGCKQEATEQPISGETVTLMIYMVGSDLEAKAGAATKDLEEIIKSGVDLNLVNVIVYAGGTNRWRNEIANEEVLTIMRLTGDGFVALETNPSRSMGDAQCLTDFLNYCYQNYPADKNCLILWDHGSGPVIGYGKDMLYDKDCLTLSEMDKALADSPFGANNKLAFVGFDACLMASAELACIWDDYADYLVASQEIEPTFGWNYSFLSQLGKVDLVTMLTSLTDNYLSTCLNYYVEQGYDPRDTTLACIDLSKAAALESAIEDLFSAATADVGLNYNTLAARRVDTRALGRATTGSEYDLVDLYDMAAQLSDLYPDQTAAVQNAIKDLVIHNATNAENCCGLSLYYPFYNKDYYEKNWSQAYAQLGIFQSYQRYLQAYEQVWLGNDLLANAQSIQPIVTQQTFTLQMTPEQAASYADARFYVMQQIGSGLYELLFISADVEEDNGTLTANFDGDVLYLKDSKGNYTYLAFGQQDSIGNTSHYILPTILSNYEDAHHYDNDVDEDNALFIYATTYLSYDKSTDKLTVNALTANSDSDLQTGKSEELNLADFHEIQLPKLGRYYLTRYENGAIKPFDQWLEHDSILYHAYHIADGFSYEKAPLEAGNYCFFFEITDTQGNAYCSDVVTFETNDKLPEPYPSPDPIEVDWTTGEKVLLYDQNNISMYLIKRRGYLNENYILQVENRNDFDLELLPDNGIVNGTIEGVTLSSGTIPAHSTVTDTSGFAFGDTQYFTDLNTIEQLSFSVTIRNKVVGKTIIDNQSFIVNFSDETRLHHFVPSASIEEYSAPYLDAAAQEQVLYEENGITVTLLQFGSNGFFEKLFLKATNNSSETAVIDIAGVSVNGHFVTSYGILTVPPGASDYTSCSLSTDFDDLQITSIESLTLYLDVSDTRYFVGGYGQLISCPITLSTSGKAAGGPVTKQTLLNEGGIKLEFIEQTFSSGISTPNYCWKLLLTNNSGKDILIRQDKVYLDGVLTAPDYTLNGVYADGECPDGQSTVLEIRYRFPTEDTPAKQIDVTFQIYNFFSTEFYQTLNKVVRLTTEGS